MNTSRYQHIDILRGLAVLFMMETHTVNGLLDPGERTGPFFWSLSFVNGLVAPTFLFCAGLGFAIYLDRKWESILAFQPPFRNYLRKCLFILLVGYSLHVPVFSLGDMAGGSMEMWGAFFQVDILQVIAISLLILLAMAVALRRRAFILAGAVVLILGVLAASPYLHKLDLSGLPIWLAPYFSSKLSPLFTLFPWSAFLFAGYVVGEQFTVVAGTEREYPLMRNLSIASLGGIGLAAGVSFFTFGLYEQEAFWLSSPEYFFIRLGVILLGFVLLRFLLRNREVGEHTVLNLFGQLSLSVYYFHLMLVYGKDVRWSYVNLFPRQLGYTECLGLTILLAGMMYAYAAGWFRLKKKYPRLAAGGLAAFVLGTIVTFLVS